MRTEFKYSRVIKNRFCGSYTWYKRAFRRIHRAESGRLLIHQTDMGMRNGALIAIKYVSIKVPVNSRQ